MPITNIGDARTPGQATELVFGPDLTLAQPTQTVVLLGHVGSSSGTSGAGVLVTINNVSDPALAKTEAEGYFGTGSELSKMVVAAVQANFARGRSNFPPLKAIGIPFAATDFGVGNASLKPLDKTEAEFVVSPYAQNGSANLALLKTQVAAMSAAGRVANGQYGTIGVAAERTTAIGSLVSPDTRFLSCPYLRDGGSPAYSIGELAAAYAATLAGNLAPFGPLDGYAVGGVAAPVSINDWITVGPSDESETILQAGFTPLRVFPNGDVAIVRAITTRTSVKGDSVGPDVTAYFDVQDFQVLYLWNKTTAVRFASAPFSGTADQPGAKNSPDLLKQMLAELLRLAKAFETANMFQAVDQLAKQFLVGRRTTDRSAAEWQTPVNVIPGLHRILGQIVTTTQFDQLVL